MRPKSLILLALALGCGLVASIGISQVMDRNARRGAGAIETAPIYIALHNINLGDPIDATMVSLQEWPKDKIPPGSIAQLEDIEGRRPRSAIIEGEPILEAKLLAPGQMADPIANIPPGYRLVTIAVDAEKSAAGLLSPGDRVDIQLFVQRDPRNGIEEARTNVILQNIRVYAVDQAVQRAAEGGEARTIAKTVSLLLTPEQASKMHLAEKVGELSLIPRNPDDEETVNWQEMKLADLFDTGSKSSRKKEQGREDNGDDVDTEDSGGGSGLLSAIQNAIPEPEAVPPFRMEIVEAEEVREMLFDAESGKPLRDLMEEAALPGQSSTGPPRLRPSAYDGGGADLPAEEFSGGGDSPVSEDDFPIDFN